MSITLLKTIGSLIIKYLPAITTVLETLSVIWKRYKETGSFKKTVQSELNKFVENSHEDLSETLVRLSALLGKGEGEKSAFVTDVLELIVKGGELTPLAGLIKEALADGELTRKEIVKIILAYELYTAELSIDDIKSATDIAEFAGYTRTVNLAQQTNITLNNLLSRVNS